MPLASASHWQFAVEKRPSKRTASDAAGQWPADQFEPTDASPSAAAIQVL